MNTLDETVGGIRIVANPGHCRVCVQLGDSTVLLSGRSSACGTRF